MNANALELAVDKDEVVLQRNYYANSASRYDSMHLNEKDEHYFALLWLEGIIEFHGIRSVLDIGAGTGRVARHLKSRNPDLEITSLEPVRELREVGYANGLATDEIIDGDAKNLPFPNGEFDLVCEFGILHHIKNPELAVNEMLRVSKVGIFISDSNNFGQGSFGTRTLKQFINALGLWRIADFVKTRGKGYTISEGDGLGYSYSVFDNFDAISRQCRTHILNTVGAGINPYKTASHVALLGIKK